MLIKIIFNSVKENDNITKKKAAQKQPSPKPNYKEIIFHYTLYRYRKQYYQSWVTTPSPSIFLCT